MANGRGWKAATADKKLYYVVGINDGVRWSMAVADSSDSKCSEKSAEELDKSFWVSGFTYADYVKELNKLYEDPANIRLPISVMYGIASNVFKRMPPDETGRRLANMRKVFAEAQEKR